MTETGSRREDLSLPKMSRQALGPIFSPIQGTPKDFSRRMEHNSGRVSQNSFNNEGEVLGSEFFRSFSFHITTMRVWVIQAAVTGKGRTVLTMMDVTLLMTMIATTRYSNLCTGLERPLGLQEVESPRFQDNRHMEVRSSALGTGPLYLPPSQEIPLVLVSVADRVHSRSIVRPNGLTQLKIPVTPWGTKPATFRLVAQCLN